MPFKLYLKVWLMNKKKLLLTFRYSYTMLQDGCQLKTLALLYL